MISIIQLNDISIKFDNKTIFTNYNNTFEGGKIYCITGPSGCGKTTLLRMISGLQKPDRGTVTYNNLKVLKPLRNIFMMHQSYTNFPWKNCLENVLFPVKYHAPKIHSSDNEISESPTRSRSRIKMFFKKTFLKESSNNNITDDNRDKAINLLEEVGLGDAIERFPNELSGGMNQRLALARTLMMMPEVILMDEPLSALDPQTRNKMQDLILKLHKETGNTIIMVTHDLNEAQKMGDVNIAFS
ncbi:MAG: ABC transporter ATP-binding protein [Bacillota bacterium]|nr:ABC transporter ATP-binding protein [Bacillota bacterium]